MTITSWFRGAADQMSSRSSLEKKRDELAGDKTYNFMKQVFGIVLLYLAQYDHSTPLAQFRLYRKIVSSESLDRFLPTTPKFRGRYVTQEVTEDGKVVEKPQKQFIECCARCVELFKQVLDTKIDEAKCIKDLLGDTYNKCKEIKKERAGRWFWESSVDAIVDTFSTSRRDENQGTPEQEMEEKRLRLTADLCKTLNRLRTKQTIVWELHAPTEVLEEDQYPWSNYFVHVDSTFDVTPPVGIRLLTTAFSKDTRVSAEVKISKADDHLVITSFKMSPMTNDKNPKNHIAENIIYKLLAEILLQRSDKYEYVLLSDSQQIMAHDYVADYNGLTPNDSRIKEKLGSYFAQEWTLSKQAAMALIDKSPPLLACGCLHDPEGMCVTIKLDTDTQPKSAVLILKKEGDALIISSMKVQPLVVDTARDDEARKDPGSRMEAVVYQFIAELLLQKLGGCTKAIFPLSPDEVFLHGNIAKQHGLIPPTKDREEERIAWIMTYEGAKKLVGGRVLLVTNDGSLQFF